ncbi:MAG TPA: nitronate monooxygenase family protein [Allosphingosinicella sp.]|nr:nitronate monooxygenase family protein [Allosphingosinicella sp.]
MPLPDALARRLKLPAIAAPMFLVSGPALTIAACKSGVIGSFPALNCRTTQAYGEWLDRIESALGPDDAPYAVNLIVHKTNTRLEADLALTVARRVPIVITSLGANAELVAAVHSYGGMVFHDVISRRHAEKVAAAGVDGIIALSAGAGGHTGTLSPFALLAEIRQVFDGLLILAGGISTGRDVAAARVMGADLVSMGTRFIATHESLAQEAYKQMLVEAAAGDIVATARLTGVTANFLKPSLDAAGLDPAAAPQGDLGTGEDSKAWRDIWSAGHGVGAITEVSSTAALCARLVADYEAARV